MERRGGELLLERVWITRAVKRSVLPGIAGTGAGGHRSDRSDSLVRAFVAELGHEQWIGDSAKIRASEVRKQKTDERDALLILDLLLAKRFPRIWVPTPAERDLRQLLWHRHKLVCLRTMLGNQLHFLAMSQGLCRKQKLFTQKGRAELAALALRPWASRRREELLKLLAQLEPAIAELDRAVREEADRREDAVLLDDPSRHWSGYLAGFCTGHRSDHSFCSQQKDRQLSGTESERGIQRRTAADRRPSASRAIPWCAGC